MQKSWKMIETLANGYSSESAQQELSNEYQDDRVQIVFKNICVLVLWMKVPSALEGLTLMLLLADFANIKWCKKPGKTLKPWHMGTHMKVLSESFLMNNNMTGLDV